MSDPILDPIERQSAVWLKLKKQLEARLAMLRMKNDSDLSPHRTARLRGRIEEVKALLSLGTDKPNLPDENEIFKD
jgi:hypothetical protein